MDYLDVWFIGGLILVFVVFRLGYVIWVFIIVVLMEFGGGMYVGELVEFLFNNGDMLV